jgi:hypothetical protein
VFTAKSIPLSVLMQAIASTSRITVRRSFSTCTRNAMPLYVAFCPDYPNSLEKRLSVREEHLKRAGKDKETGKSGESWGGWC